MSKTNPFSSVHATEDLLIDDGGTAVLTKPLFSNPDLAQADQIVCAKCGAHITSASLRIAVGGSHRHTTPTPHEIDQEIGCYALAPGCVTIGHFALDFTFNDDGFWQMALCSVCGDHLGWHYQTSGEMGFYGLILDHLAAASKDDDHA